MELVPYNEAVLSSVEGVVRQMLNPYASVRLWQHPEAHLQHVHVNEGDLRPV